MHNRTEKKRLYNVSAFLDPATYCDLSGNELKTYWAIILAVPLINSNGVPETWLSTEIPYPVWVANRLRPIAMVGAQTRSTLLSGTDVIC